MAEIVINPDIANLDTDSSLAARKTIYTTLLDGMKSANEGTPPDYSQAPYSVPQTGADGQPLTWKDADGNTVVLTTPNQDAIQKKMDEISLIQMQNAAYLFAKVIDRAADTAATGIDLSGYVQKAGDNMTGMFTALHGFEAGYNGEKLFEIVQNTKEEPVAHLYSHLIVDYNLDVKGRINADNSGIWFSKHQSIYYENGTLKFDNDNINFRGDITVDGTFELGSVRIDSSGIYWGTNEFYHSGNSNLPTVDWTMKNANVHGTLIVKGDTALLGRLSALQGFDLGENGVLCMTSRGTPDDLTTFVDLWVDLDINQEVGIRYDHKYIIQGREGTNKAISFSAPGRIMNLGDSHTEGGLKAVPTEYITIQADLYPSFGRTTAQAEPMLSASGAGYFSNGLKAKTANAGAVVLQTYFHDDSDCGVVFPKNIAFGDTYGPKLSAENNNETFRVDIPWTHVGANSQITQHLGYTLKFGESNSIWHYAPNIDVSLHFDTDGEFFIFDKPIEADTFSINSQKYKTQLRENALFLREGIFIEGVTDGMAFTGNAYFNNNVQSQRFASGFAGYGWGVIKSEFAGGYHATFDELTVRKKMRIYELEVQKIGATNGSLWVSDSCSGDIVEELSSAY